MIQIRKGIFETNSSSTHSLAVPKIVDNYVTHIDFHIGNYGWAFREVSAPNYLYTAMLAAGNKQVALKYVKRLEEVLKSHNITYTFETPEWEKWGSKLYLENGEIDHSEDLSEILDELLNDEDKLLRFLSCGKVFTGNDNCNQSEYRFVHRNVEEYTEYDSEITHKNPYYLGTEYEWLFKGN